MKPRIVDLVAAAEEALSLPHGSILGFGRTAPISRARQIVMHLARLEGYTLKQIGIALGRDHATVCAGLARCQTLPDLVGHAGAVRMAYELGVRACRADEFRARPRFKAGGHSRMVRTPQPIVRALFAATAQQEMSMGRLAHLSGVLPHTLESWKRGLMPRVDNLARALRVVGFKLTLEPIKKEGDDGVLSHREVGNVSALQGPIPSVDQVAPGHPR